VTLIDALADRQFFGRLAPFRDLASWTRWLAFLRALFALPMAEGCKGAPQMQTAIGMKDAAEKQLSLVEAEVVESQRRLAEAQARADEERRCSLEVRVAPLRERAGQLEAGLAALDAKAEALLRDGVRKARALYDEHVVLHNQRCEIELEMAAVTRRMRETFPPAPFSAFVEDRVRRFHYEDVTADGPASAREEN